MVDKDRHDSIRKGCKAVMVVYLWTKEEGRDLEYRLPPTRYTAAAREIELRRERNDGICRQLHQPKVCSRNIISMNLLVRF